MGLIAVKLSGLQLHRAHIAPSKAGLTFLEFRLHGRDSEATPGYWRRKASATVARREVVLYPDESVKAGGGWPTYCEVVLRSLGDSDLDSQHPVLAQGVLTKGQLVRGSGPLEVELCTEGGYGDVVGTLHLQLSNQGPASDSAPLSKEADDWGNSWDDEDESASDSSGSGEESPASYEWTILDPVPLHHSDTWPSMRLGVAWEGCRPPSAAEVVEMERLQQEFKPFRHQTLMLLARCKLALEASGQAVPGGALLALPQSGWRGVVGSHHTSWKAYLLKVQEKLRDLGVSEDVLRLTELPPPWGDDASRLGSGNDPLTIAYSLSSAGLDRECEPLYHYVYGRSIAEALGDIPEHWREEERHVQRMLREAGVENPAQHSGVGEGLL